MSDINETLADKQPLYGSYSAAASLSQGIKATMRCGVNWQKLSPEQLESMEMIANRIGRILSGDPNHYESWHGISGFAELIAREIGKPAG